MSPEELRAHVARVVRLDPGQAPEILAASTLFDSDLDPEAVRAYLEDPRNVFLLALEGRTPVGFLRGTALTQLRTRRPQMFLYEIAVLDGHRRRGIGRSLVGSLLEHCSRQRYDEVFVLTDPGNVAAVGLYRATGAVPETPADRMYVYRFSPRPRGEGDEAPRSATEAA
jgi:ribosomal protein S18 acetylase RimI-like enzyme